MDKSCLAVQSSPWIPIQDSLLFLSHNLSGHNQIFKRLYMTQRISLLSGLLLSRESKFEWNCNTELSKWISSNFQTFWLSSWEFTTRWAPCHCQQGLKTLFQTLFQRQEQVFITWCLLWSYQQSSELWEISLVQTSRLSRSPHRHHTKYSLERLCRLDEFWQKPALTLLQSPQVSNSGQACTFWDSAWLLSSSPRVVSKHLKDAKKQEAREKDAQVTDFSSVAPKSQHQPEWQA